MTETSHSSGGKVLAGWVLPGGSEGESVPRFSRSFSLAAGLGLVYSCTTLISLPHMTWLSSLCVYVSPGSPPLFFF